MFVRADSLLREAPEGDHLIGYHWHGFRPFVSIHPDGSGRPVQYRPENVDLSLSKEKTCVGRFEEGRYLPCPNRAKVSTFTQCRECASSWIPIQECVFDPQCGGERCDCEFCSREHLVYVAFLGRRVKVGMTSVGRLETRGIEQGADAIVPLVECQNRREARHMENLLSNRLGVPQRITQKQSLEAVAHPSVGTEVRSRYHALLDRCGGTCEPAEPLFLEEYPIEKLEREPRLTVTEGAHKGELVGMKGKFALYRSKGAVLALNMSDAVARWDRSTGLLLR